MRESLLLCTALMMLMAQGAPVHNRKLWELEVGGNTGLKTVARPTVAVNEAVHECHLYWRSLRHKEHPPSHVSTLLPHSTNNPATRKRGRRHAVMGMRSHGHGQLMRVGCILGTCQVQNLSHRLYQLIGQSGREESSPINPRSPHSYG